MCSVFLFRINVRQFQWHRMLYGQYYYDMKLPSQWFWNALTLAIHCVDSMAYLHFCRPLFLSYNCRFSVFGIESKWTFYTWLFDRNLFTLIRCSNIPTDFDNTLRIMIMPNLIFDRRKRGLGCRRWLNDKIRLSFSLQFTFSTINFKAIHSAWLFACSYSKALTVINMVSLFDAFKWRVRSKS